MQIVQIKTIKTVDKTTKQPILEIGLRFDIQKVLDIKKNLGKKSLNEFFDGVLKEIKKECNCA